MDITSDLVLRRRSWLSWLSDISRARTSCTETHLRLPGSKQLEDSSPQALAAACALAAGTGGRYAAFLQAAPGGSQALPAFQRGFNRETCFRYFIRTLQSLNSDSREASSAWSWDSSSIWPCSICTNELNEALGNQKRFRTNVFT